MSLDKSGLVWTCQDKSKPVWKNLDQFGQDLTSLDQSGQAWSNLDKFGQGYHGLVPYITVLAQGPMNLKICSEGGGERCLIDLLALSQVTTHRLTVAPVSGHFLKIYISTATPCDSFSGVFAAIPKNCISIFDSGSSKI